MEQRYEKYFDRISVKYLCCSSDHVRYEISVTGGVEQVDDL